MQLQYYTTLGCVYTQLLIKHLVPTSSGVDGPLGRIVESKVKERTIIGIPQPLERNETPFFSL